MLLTVIKIEKAIDYFHAWEFKTETRESVLASALKKGYIRKVGRAEYSLINPDKLNTLASTLIQTKVITVGLYQAIITVNGKGYAYVSYRHICK